MRMRVGRLVPGALALALVPVLAASCGQSSVAVPGAVDGGEETYEASYAMVRDASRRKDGATADVDADHRWDRMQRHEGQVLATMRLQVVYIGLAGESGAPDFDVFHKWIVSSAYWGLMKQYGVSAGTFLGSVRISESEIFPPGLVQDGLIRAEELGARVYALLHPSPPEPLDAGGALDADGAAATDANVGDVVDAGRTVIPTADAYLFYLPAGVNVSLGEMNGHLFQTCVEAGGYHTFDGTEPYAVIPPCSFGRSGLAISHELAEMATDPFPSTGWFSDMDVDNAGGEIGDLCNQAAPQGVEGWSVTQLWSNAAGDCQPK